MFEHDKSPSESEASPKMPVLTVIATILVLFVFAGLVGLTYYYGKDLSSKPVGENGADQLRELCAAGAGDPDQLSLQRADQVVANSHHQCNGCPGEGR